MDISLPPISLLLISNHSEIPISVLCSSLLSTNDYTLIEEKSDPVDKLSNATFDKLKVSLSIGTITIIDITSYRNEERAAIRKLAKSFHTPCSVFIIYDPSIRAEDISRLLKRYKNEGIRNILSLKTAALDSTYIKVRANISDKYKDDTGPFDLIGDVHGCYEELIELLVKLGYNIDSQVTTSSMPSLKLSHAGGRKVIFVGDLVDKGPKTPEVLHLAMTMIEQGIAYCVQGNHEAKLVKYLMGKSVTLRHGLNKSVAQLKECPPKFIDEVKDFMDNLPHHLIFDNGKLIVAHAGIKEEMQGRDSGAIRAFALYGETTGKLDDDGLPERKNWALNYRGEAVVVHGHVPVVESKWLNRVLDIDTGCVYGGKLTALRYPSMNLVSIEAKGVYSTPKSGSNPFQKY